MPVLNVRAEALRSPPDADCQHADRRQRKIGNNGRLGEYPVVLQEHCGDPANMLTFDCPEFDDFQSALRGVKVRYVMRARQQRNWRLTRTDLQGVGLMMGREGAANVCTGAALADHFNVFVCLSDGGPFVVNGEALDGNKIGWMVPGQTFRRDSSDPASWLRITMSNRSVTSWFDSREDEREPALLSDNAVRNANGRIAELVRLAHRIVEVDALCEEGLHSPGKEHAIQIELMDTALRTVVPGADSADLGRRLHNGAKVLDRALALISSRTDAPIYVEDLCRVTGVSERSLRNVFCRHFGMAPHQYLMMIRLDDVRTAIHEAGDGATVSRICSNFGIWDFGRFAGHYRRMFGLLPSEDLAARRQARIQGRFTRGATCRSSVARGYSPNSA